MKKAPGMLPCSYWLITHGYSSLYAMMRTHPEAFAHIKQSTPYRTLQKHIAHAETLAARHKKLPGYAWLTQHGHNALYAAMQTHPEAFAHIPRERRHHTLQEHVLQAEKLAKKHGKVPNHRWLVANGYNSLAQMMHTRPRAFSHLKQISKRGRTLRQNTIVAESLARRYGHLPNPKWLQTHGYNGVHKARRNHPEAFAHIKQDSKRGRTLTENVTLAEALARQHGAMPPPQWLYKNGYGGLKIALTKHPHAFAHIPRTRERHTLKENVTLASRLIKAQGKLPSGNWLRTHGYSGLETTMRHNPEAFAHLKP